MQFDSASFLPDLGLIANQKKFCHSIFQNARFLESGSQNANMATLKQTADGTTKYFNRVHLARKAENSVITSEKNSVGFIFSLELQQSRGW